MKAISPETYFASLNLSNTDDITKREAENMKDWLREAIELGYFKILVKDGKMIGFFTWTLQKEGEGFSVLIQNMVIFKGCESKENLAFLRDYFRKIYPEAKKFYWKNRKKDKEFIVKGG